MTASDPLAARRAELERRLASLSPEKRAKVESAAGQGTMSATQNPGVAATSAMGRRAPGDPVPMSFAQELFWRMEVAAPGHAYNVPRTVRLQGPLDMPALQRALDAVVARHETLRTTFQEIAGEPRQVVHPPRAVSVSVEDLGAIDASVRETLARDRLRALTRRPFDLARDAQLRVTVMRLDETDHVLLLESHHVVSDGVSRGILLRDLAAFYREYTGGALAALPELAVQYGDFSIWQRKHLAGARLDELLGYWRGRLLNAPPLDLPTDRPRAAVTSLDGATCDLLIPAHVADALKRLSRGNDATLFMTVLAVFNTLLARYSGQDDIVVGSPIAGRLYPEVDGVVGCFLNTLVLRTSLVGDPTFVELLPRVREVVLGAFEHQEVPYERLVLELRDNGRSGTEPLFNVGFAFHDPEGRPLSLAGTTSVPFGADRGATKTDLALSFGETSGGLRAAIVYRTQLFDAGTIDRMLGHLSTLLGAVIEHPDVPISQLRILTDGERAAVLSEWNATALPYARTSDLAQLVRQQVARTPAAPAVVFEGVTTTYAELDERVERLTSYLASFGVGPGAVVALYVERSLEMVVALLAIHRAGGTYLPLDPSYPHDRLEFMLADSGAHVVVTEDALRDVLALDGVHIVSLDGDRDAIEMAPRSTGKVAADPDRLAYLIYTSGSTGKPKGVGVTHRNVVNFLAGFGRDVPFGAGSTLVAVTPLSFDISVLEMFHPLTNGAQLVVASRDTALNPGALAALLVDTRATHLQATPATWRMLVEAGWPGHAGLIALCGGEALQGTLAAALLARGLVLWNLYGPTEATIWATMHRVSAADVADGASSATMPIGRPMANVQVYVLDATGQPVPPGVPGELFIAGDGIARGYHARPELTAERFVADPFSTHDAARMYRTGDRARWRNDGVLDFLGRLDQQVKLRGHRIELGEIEHALAALPGVGVAAVMVREDRPGDARLVAYVVPSEEAGDQAVVTHSADWRTALASQLPNYMVPSAFVQLERFPLTPNGKLDRKALPVPADDALGDGSLHVAPRTPLEERLVDIWQDVLTRQRIGVHETIAALAARIQAAPQAAMVDGDSRVRRVEGDTAPLSPAQELLWLLQRTSPDVVAYNMTEQWRVEGAVDAAALQRALDALIERHDVFRTHFATEQGASVQRVAARATVNLRVADIPPGDTGDSEATALLRETAATPFDLTRDVLLRATLVTRTPESHLLLIATHHIVYDGWSRGVMLRELGALYDTARGVTESMLAPLPIRYRDFAAWQHDRLRGPERERQLEYWRNRLAGASLHLELPRDRPGDGRPTFAGGRDTEIFPPALLTRLHEVARANNATLFMVLLAAFQSLLHRYGGQSDIVVGTVVAGRPRRELEGLIGHFVNTLPLRATFDDDPTFRQLLARVRDGQLSASEHADVPFEDIAQEMAGGAGAAPVCQAMFVLQNTAGAPLMLGDATLKASSIASDTAKFDLSLSMGEQANGLRATMQYRADLFDASTIHRMLGHLRTLLDDIASAPATPVSRLSMLGTDERHKLLVEWNDTDAAWPEHATLHQLFELQAQRRGDAVAVQCGSISLSYSELDRRANRLAWQLRARGVGPDTLVAVCMDKSADIVAVLLAVLKAGGAYVPIDPAYPDDRVAFTLMDSGAALLITDSALSGRVSTFGVPVLVASDAWRDSAAARDDTPPPSAGPTNLCYVIYTSGSTGRPKGVLIEHRNVVRLLFNDRFQFSFSDADVWTVFHSFSFDFSVWEMYGALLFGGRLVVIPKQVAQDPSAFLDVLESQRVTVLNQVPSAFYSLMQQELARDRRGLALRYVIFGGEALQPALLREWKARYPDTTLVNMFGITETTVHVTFKEIGDAEIRDGASNIGGPIPTLTTYVLDTHLQLAPIGATGELCVGGAGVARGYLNRPDLNAERFVAHPFRAGERMYRSGDLGRMRPSGEIEYLGRRDAQVKLRGFRVELGEIEASIASLPGVRAVAAIVRPDASGQQRLLGYVVKERDSSLTPQGIRTSLRDRLPEHMVPAVIMMLDVLPTTSNGKTDAKALPEPDGGASAREYVAPRNGREAAVASAFADVLRVERVGADDDFYELGGHSLLAIRIAARLQETLGTSVPMRLVFEHSSVGRLAAAIEQDSSSRPVSAPPRVAAVSRSAFRRAKPGGEA